MTDVATVDLHFIDMPAEEAAADTTPLVVIHGLLGSADNWRSHLKVWQRSRRVIALDLRNHGRSPHAEGMRGVKWRSAWRAWRRSGWRR